MVGTGEYTTGERDFRSDSTRDANLKPRCRFADVQDTSTTRPADPTRKMEWLDLFALTCAVEAF